MSLLPKNTLHIKVLPLKSVYRKVRLRLEKGDISRDKKKFLYGWRKPLVHVLGWRVSQECALDGLWIEFASVLVIDMDEGRTTKCFEG